MKRSDSFSFTMTVQEHPLGCGVACVAARCKISYATALELFAKKENAWGRGFYCTEMVSALEKAKLKYEFSAFKSARHRALLDRSGTIVFVGPCEAYPLGHYLLRVDGGWMNPWSNCPQMVPVESAIQDRLPGEVTYVVYESATS